MPRFLPNVPVETFLQAGTIWKKDFFFFSFLFFFFFFLGGGGGGGGAPVQLNRKISKWFKIIL
jgi:hypothetical protein